MFTLELCKTKDAYKATLSQHQQLNIRAITKAEHVLLDGGIMVVIRVKQIEVICQQYGELMIKTPSLAEAKHIAKHMENYIERRTTA